MRKNDSRLMPLYSRDLRLVPVSLFAGRCNILRFSLNQLGAMQLSRVPFGCKNNTESDDGGPSLFRDWAIHEQSRTEALTPAILFYLNTYMQRGDFYRMASDLIVYFW